VAEHFCWSVPHYRDFRFPGGQGGGCSSGPCSHAGHSHGSNQPAASMNVDPDLLQEYQEEIDDPERLARNRAMDEYKDDHRRGDGNRHNRS
jgi:hypothetical protein